MSVAVKESVAEETTMRVKKRNGIFEPVDVNKIVRAVGRCAKGLKQVDTLRVATKTIGGLYEGATTKELDKLSINTAATLIAEEPEYSRLAARLLVTYIEKEVRNQEIHSFSQSISTGFKLGLINGRTAKLVAENSRKLNDKLESERNNLFEYFGLQTVYDRYLLKEPETRLVIETPQYFFMRVACGLARDVVEAIEYYNLFSTLDYIPSTPTLFNSGAQREQLSSCFLLDSPQDDLESIYRKYSDIAMLSKYAGGIGLAYHRVRSSGSLIRGTNGLSNGIVPWLKTLDSSIAAVNQGGKRKGACCVYLETWHADIEPFLELRDNTGDEARRTHNLNLANWIPDLFMRRVEADGDWSLFDPKVVPHLPDLYGTEFEKAYAEAEENKLFAKQIKARDLYGRMVKTLAQTGNGWMTFKDASNRKSNQTKEAGNVIHLSNLCTEILEVSSNEETAVCNLGSLNLAKYVADGAFDFEKLVKNVRLAVRQLDYVIDINFYTIPQAKTSNSRWRPIGLGIMGLQDVFFQLHLPFDSEEALKLSTKIQEEIYFHALSASCALAETFGKHENFDETRAADGILQFDLWNVQPENAGRWNDLRERIKTHGLRNSLMIAIAPTATIASIVGSYESIEPQVSNLFKRETLSGDFMQINRYLVNALKELGLWTEEIRTKIKLGEGSIQNIKEIPEETRHLYRTAWEIPMKSLVDMAAERGAFIDQSQSLNLFMESPNIGKLSSMYMYAWKKGLKTTYYLRSRPATSINKTTVSAPTATSVKDEEAIACSLENPESCDACQ
ncbi:MAG: ribonucleoside-diphosphate reductase, alpha subunit [Acidobacteria bacterium]|nr:ribonucleoside-diphosphate reductase, alpha subunit [Acidobacteriota bacterium]